MDRRIRAKYSIVFSISHWVNVALHHLFENAGLFRVIC